AADPSAHWLPSSAELRVEVSHFRQVGGARQRSQVVKQVVAAGVAMQLADRRARVVQGAEADRLGRTGFLAGGAKLRLGDLPMLDLRCDPRSFNPLNAIGAFLH